MDHTSTVSLNRLLFRLDRTLLSPSDEQLHRLRSSPYERNKVSTNVEHARTTLLTLEKQASTIRVQSERQRVQQELLEKREVIKRLNSRLDELNQLGDEEEDDDDGEDDPIEDGEETANDQPNGDIPSEDSDSDQPLPSYAPAHSDYQDGLETTGAGGEATAAHAQLASTLQSELRARKPPSAADNRDAATSTAREQLFAGRPQQPPDPSLSQSETLLSHNRTEQENLTTGLLSLARSLKESSLNFSSALEGEKDVLKRAAGGLDKSALGMEAAERKMGALRRMSEGQGWWGRIKLYGMIFGLWVACFLFVFVGPKLRF
ncbi:uncharacterized protein LTR77_004799 [Saxophila tyrrhenica]|uniref:Synaptobrevin n=1 Tax=Saxophila tyrrhenica TaxID=1690608 RepID=A0AAV9PEF7_9PEZI|nr:hypothetical protein LTR77_004799 [Saxophila tyrrhenica]